MISACSPPPPVLLDPQVEHGRELFFTENFGGNGRTCGSCHPAENNFTLDPAFIATIPPDDPLFIAESDAALSANFENPRLMRRASMILENLDGFGDLSQQFTMRGIPHTQGLRTSIASRTGPLTGWSGDGAPGDGSLRSFATGAVIQHFTKSLNRVAGVDFRLPTDEELDALEAFQLALGRQEDLSLPLDLKDVIASRGQAIFNDPTSGKCFACHFNAGANGAPAIFGADAGNLNFNTGVEALPDHPADLLGEPNPTDDGFGRPGIGEFNTPSLVEAADTGPFFHNNAVNSLEAAIAFYNGDAFTQSPAGQLIIGATGSGINLDATQVEAVAAFLRVINVLENIRESAGLLNAFVKREYLGHIAFDDLLSVGRAEIDDAIEVLAGGRLHPTAVMELGEARRLVSLAIEGGSLSSRQNNTRQAMEALERARFELVEQ
jgi:mono/diheme cytochrome c family protein